MPQNVKEKPAIRNIILPDLLKMLDIGVFQQNTPLLHFAASATFEKRPLAAEEGRVTLSREAEIGAAYSVGPV
ncbi:MAG: hypothetical protein ABJZ56_15365 [Paracoccaceae bacterium]